MIPEFQTQIQYIKRKNYLRDRIRERIYFTSVLYRKKLFVQLIFVLFSVLIAVFDDIKLFQEHVTIVSSNYAYRFDYYKRTSKIAYEIYFSEVKTSTGNKIYLHAENPTGSEGTLLICRDILYIPTMAYGQKSQDKYYVNFAASSKECMLYISVLFILVFIFEKVVKFSMPEFDFLCIYAYILMLIVYVFQIDFLRYVTIPLYLGLSFLGAIFLPIIIVKLGKKYATKHILLHSKTPKK